MDILTFENVSFTYALGERPALRDINLSFAESGFYLICGPSGSGKSTLLRMMKKNLIPGGDLSGSVAYMGTEISEMDNLSCAAEIGFVQQNPAEAIVTDVVWHELAFGLENLGLPNEVMRRRVAEMAAFFGIESWYDKPTGELSGGQQQMLNLASVMVMQPKVLLLDEPTSQLDPLAAGEFLQMQPGTGNHGHSHRTPSGRTLCHGGSDLCAGKRTGKCFRQAPADGPMVSEAVCGDGAPGV